MHYLCVRAYTCVRVCLRVHARARAQDRNKPPKEPLKCGACSENIPFVATQATDGSPHLRRDRPSHVRVRTRRVRASTGPAGRRTYVLNRVI